MTKYRVNNSQVPHLWAHQSQDHAEGNGSIRFSGKRLYSYSALIGRLIEAPDGSTVALHVARTWSVTTSSHQSAGRCAVNHLTSFTVADLGEYGEPDHAANLAHLVTEYFGYVASCFRKRNYEDWDARQLGEKWQHAIDYARMFGLDRPSVDLTKDSADLDAYHHSPEKAAIRAKRAAEKKIADAAALKARLALHAGLIADWRSGIGHALPYGLGRDANGGALLRINGDELQTSLGASVPLSHAVRVFRIVAKCRADGTSWHRNGETIRVGSFQVDSIEADGSFIAGCHSFSWTEVENAARLAGIIDEPHGFTIGDQLIRRSLT